MFYSFLDQDGDGYTSVEELVSYFNALDSQFVMWKLLFHINSDLIF